MDKYQKKPEKKTIKSSLNKKIVETPAPKTKEKSLITRLDAYFGKNLNKFFYASLLLTIILGIYLFDVKIHEGGDDSSYIEMAYNFVKGKAFPTFHGEFYSIFLSLPILIFGIKLVILKIFSFFFLIGHLVFFYLAFKKRVSPTILVFTLLLSSVSSNILFFASQTYTEALYMFIQSLVLFVLFKLIDHLKENKFNNLDLWKYWLLSGFLIFLAVITRNLGITLLISIILLFLFTKKFYAILYIIAGYYIFSFPFGLYKKLVWNISESGISQQMDILLYKNPYNAALGQEDFSGMVTRLIENTKIYLSRYFYQSIGLKDPDITEATLFPAIILVVILLTGLFFAIRKNKYMLLTAIYLGGSIFTTFISLAQSWGQLRMIVIFIPLIFLVASYGLYELSQIKRFRFLFPLFLLLFVFIFFKTFGQTVSKAKNNQKVLSKNIEGNKYYGFTPDWINFLKMSEWVGKNIPDSVSVASRKPSMSFIYSGGKNFYGIYRMPTENGDSSMNKMKEQYNGLRIFNLNEMFQKKVPSNLQFFLKQNMNAFFVVENDIFGIVNIDNQLGGQITGIIDQFKIDHYVDAETFMDYVHKRNQAYYAVEPDLLLSQLRKNNVRYVILASLRMNPKQKTGNIVSTVQRYLYFIEIKYPNMFSLVHQIGGEEDEPSKLVKLNYEIYGM